MGFSQDLAALRKAFARCPGKKREPDSRKNGTSPVAGCALRRQPGVPRYAEWFDQLRSQCIAMGDSKNGWVNDGLMMLFVRVYPIGGVLKWGYPQMVGL